MNIHASLVSTIIPVYNRAVFLEAAVESVLAQSYRPIEVILVDDGSTDDTPELIQSIVSGNPDIVRSIRIANCGPGGARERGRQIARGEFIQYLDSDDRLLPNKFTAQVEALQSNPDCGVSYGKTCLINETGHVLVAPFKKSGVRFESLFPELLVDRWWNTHTPLYRRSVCDQVGAWTTMRMGEDWHYDARVGALGTKLVFCNEFVSQHRQHTHERLTGGGLSVNALRDFGQLIPTLYFCAKQAGVEVGGPEMQHFSRWAFSLARQLGRSGQTKLAHECFEVARKADCAGGSGTQYRLVGTMARLLGWRIVGTICESFSKLRRRPGSDTMKQAWMT
ncbi:GalNAc(5)-diNAcBac-PP-undecaprenol beta-1,3-glucosyltransferase [Novipirellula galeiformis]|uniref:GalNAc(5)-diNAcBac-PP-undecaprenol beta-1,3-glucosyltransferase n=1 Tax=Novipirellula galeiformis TaxID=2528004 RepID=A0A5C6CQF4_9BACT|nr:glycosyltransferase family A protein [Novipirellula galeiformis]TWU27173.1 GalNAc(5)-diNAcBac-PP-undecaprenol beta-1,3-glucosyltransferase [Novipirellula galeiformis]